LTLVVGDVREIQLAVRVEGQRGVAGKLVRRDRRTDFLPGVAAVERDGRSADDVNMLLLPSRDELITVVRADRMVRVVRIATIVVSL